MHAAHGLLSVAGRPGHGKATGTILVYIELLEDLASTSSAVSWAGSTPSSSRRTRRQAS